MAAQNWQGLSFSRQQGLSVPLLAVLAFEIIALILLLIFWLPHGNALTVAIGPGNIIGTGGDITVRASCEAPPTMSCPSCPACPECTCEVYCKTAFGTDAVTYARCLRSCTPPETCEDYCRIVYGNDKTMYDNCIREYCEKPKTCEDECRDRYKGASTAVISDCIRIECRGADKCETYCWERYPDDYRAFLSCVKKECTEEKPCEEECRDRYPNDITLFQGCVENECLTPESCEKYCWSLYSNDARSYAECVESRCRPTITGPSTEPEECRDSDGNDVNTAGVVTFGGQKYPDYCADSMRVNEYVCRDGKPFASRMTCPGACVNGACTAGTAAPQITPIKVPLLKVPLPR